MNVFEIVDGISDGILDSDVTEPSQFSNEIEVLSHRLGEQRQFDTKQLNKKFEEMLKQVRINKKCKLTNRQENTENIRPFPSK